MERWRGGNHERKGKDLLERPRVLTKLVLVLSDHTYIGVFLSSDYTIPDDHFVPSLRNRE